MISRRAVCDGVAEVVELEVGEGSEVTRAPLKELPLTRGLVATVVRSPAIWVPGGDDQLKAGDSVIVLVQSDSADEVLGLFSARNGD